MLYIRCESNFPHNFSALWIFYGYWSFEQEYDSYKHALNTK